jgi:TP901 family phage tail tape measure protein
MEDVGIRFIAEGQAAFKNAVDGARSEVGAFYDKLDNAPVKASVVQSALTGAFTAISSAALEAFAAAGRAVVGFVTDSIGLAGDFQQGMSVLGAASGATQQQMALLRQTSIALGNDLELPNTSAVDAAEAMTELVKAGLSVDNTMKAAKGTLQLAAAAQIEEAEAAAITANVLNTFKLSGDQAVIVADQLAAGANASSASITDLSQGVQQAGFAFQAYGQDSDDLITSLALLTNVGLTGSDAGTALKNAMLKLGAPTKEGAALMKSLGINVFDAQGNMKPMRDIIDILNKSLAGMSQEQRNAALNTILLSDGAKAIIPLLDAGVEGFDKMNAAVNENGAAAKMAGAQTDGFKGAQMALQSQIETLQLIIGEKLLPVLTSLFQNVLSPAIQTVMNLAETMFDAGVASGEFGEVLDSIVPGLGDVAFAIGDGIGEALDTIIPLFRDIAEVAGEYINKLVDVITLSIEEIQKFIDQHGEEIAAIFDETWLLIRDIVALGISVFENVLIPALTAVANFIREHSSELQLVFSTAWNVIKTIITTALTLISGIVNAALALLSGDTNASLEIIKNTFITVWNNIKSSVEAVVNGLRNSIANSMVSIRNSIVNAMNNALASVRNQLGDWIGIGKGIMDSIVAGINSAIDTVLRTLKIVMMQALAAAISIFPGPIQDAIKAILGIGSVQSTSTNSSRNANGVGGSFSKSFNLTLNTTQSSVGVISDFEIMKAMAY